MTRPRSSPTSSNAGPPLEAAQRAPAMAMPPRARHRCQSGVPQAARDRPCFAAGTRGAFDRLDAMTDTPRHVSRSSLTLAFAALLLAGCHVRTTDLVSGTYRTDDGNKSGNASALSWTPDATLVLDLDAQKVTIQAGDGLQVFS